MNRFLLMPLILLPLLASCGPTPLMQAREAQLNKVVGDNEFDLLRRDGPPDKVYDKDGQRHLAYVEKRVIPYPIPLDQNELWRIYRLGPLPPGTFGPRIVDCRTDFAVQNGKVAGYSLHGECG